MGQVGGADAHGAMSCLTLAATGVSLWLLSAMTQAQAIAGAIAVRVGTLAFVLARQPFASR